MKSKGIDLVTILGHTAGGKTGIAAHLAQRIGGEIISADSRQVYRGMDIGTGKDYDDYLVEGVQIPFHLIDIVEAGYEYNVYQFQQDFYIAYTNITERKRVPVLCGGSGLYIESVLRNYKMVHVPINKDLREELGKKDFGELEEILKQYGPLHNVSDTVNKKRLIRAIEIAMYQGVQPDSNVRIPHLNPASALASAELVKTRFPVACGGVSEHNKNKQNRIGDSSPLTARSFNPLVIGIKYDRENRRRRITERLKQRLENGMIDEVAGLLNQGIEPEKMEYYGLEYRYVSLFVRQALTFDDMFNRLNTAIHQFAKRQMTYFRGMERRGIHIHWLDGQLSLEEKLKNILVLYDPT
ncbi:MAG: tRNA dimethylallyltransferase [Bacteroidales bacterium]|nr:tRNA dimethylallyltransferase [Bacteroidales bacterium]